MITARKIAHVPGLGLMAMPATYDPARITAEDATHDSAICGAVEELRPLRDASVACAELARDTTSEGYTDEEASRRERLAERALDVTESAWDDAMRAAADGNAKDLADAIGRARNVAEELGDSTQEKAALALVAGLS